MTPFTVRELMRATHGALVQGDLAVSIAGVGIDSRTLAVGDAFFAIRGHRLDGHQFLGDAAGRGAACLVVHALPDDLPASVPLVMVDDTTRALGRLAAWYRSRFPIPVVAVTGSNGKTTTKEMIAAVLAERWRTHRPQASFNNQWGLPLTLLGLRPEHEALVVEIGANQPGEIAALAAIAQPTVAVVTTVAAVHTEFFGSLDGVRDEKAALVRALGPGGHAVLNADDPRVAWMARETTGTVAGRGEGRSTPRAEQDTVAGRGEGRSTPRAEQDTVITFGRAATARVRAIGEIAERPEGISFTLAVDGAERPIRLAFAGRHNVTNALAAAAAGVALGVGLDDIARGLGTARPVKGRCVWRDAGRVRILDDTYNANPVSVPAALDTVAAQRGDRRLVVVLGDMLELGPITDEAHREVGRAVAALAPAAFLGVGRHMALAVEVARDAGLAGAQHTTTYEDTVAELLKRVEPGDVVLVKGSRAMRMERVVDALVARLGRAAGPTEA